MRRATGPGQRPPTPVVLCGQMRLFCRWSMRLQPGDTMTDSLVRAGLIAMVTCTAAMAWTNALADQEATAGENVAAVDPVIAALMTDENSRVKAMQQALAAAGYSPGPADGDWGAASWNALKQWRATQSDLQLSRENAFALNRLMNIAPPEAGVAQVLVNGQHLVQPAAGETRPFQWDAKTNAWKAPKDYAFNSQSQGWVQLKVGAEQDLLLVFDGAHLSAEGQLLLGEPLGSRRLEATLVTRDGKLLGRTNCRIGEAALISDVVVPCGFAVTLP